MTREVSFRCTCRETLPGTHVRVVGGCKALGDWDVRRALALRTSGADFPVWSSEWPALLPETAAVEYKYVVASDNLQDVRWESTPNRMLHLASLSSRGICPAPHGVVVEDSFSRPVEPDKLRFRSLTDAEGENQKGSGNFPESVHPPATAPRPVENDAAEGLFQPTMRERCPSMSMLATRSETLHPRRTGSMSLLVEPAPEVMILPQEDARAGSHAQVVPEAGDLMGMVREESCCNLLLFTDEEPVEEAKEPDTFEGQYKLLGEGPFGEGNFGLVWRCTRKGNGAERAAKIVKKARLHARERELLLGEEGEVRTHKKLKHRHIVELFEFFEDTQNVTLVLEYCPGGDLFDAIVRHSADAGRGLPEHQAVVASRHILSALAYLHDLSIVHRDIKCENVLLSMVNVPLEHNVFKLCDFGFAAHDRGAGLHDRLGSPDTVAPEVVNGLCYSFPADVWSIGVLVYMMLAASPPFKAPTDAEVLSKVRQGRYSLSGPIWDSVSAPPKHVITSLMIIEAKLRPTAVEALGKAWFQEDPSHTPA